MKKFEMNSERIVTRFAPSPTGMLHIGSARTALFNFIFSKKVGGSMLLRIEDTDIGRNTEDSLNSITNGLDWLGIKPSEPLTFQSANLARHKEAAKILISQKKAYYCYCETPKGQKIGYKYSGKCRGNYELLENSDISPVIRLDSSSFTKIEFHDEILGNSEFGRDNLDDIIIIRSNNSPTYMFAVVIDDHDSGVNFVFRGNDHHTNTACQIMIYDLFNWKRPKFAHLPLIHAEDGTKMSKRRHKVDIQDFKKMGILAEPLNLYLMSLGWSHNNLEPKHLEEVINLFDLKDINKSGAKFNMDKLQSVNSMYLKELPIDKLTNYLKDFLETNSKDLLDFWPAVLNNDREKILQRSTNLGSIIHQISYLAEDFKPPKTADRTITQILIEYLSQISQNDWSNSTMSKILKEISKNNEIEMKAIWPILRFALTGIEDSYSVLEVAQNLGKEICIERLEFSLNLANF